MISYYIYLYRQLTCREATLTDLKNDKSAMLQQHQQWQTPALSASYTIYQMIFHINTCRMIQLCDKNKEKMPLKIRIRSFIENNISF